jgi:Putative binding domain, N-terminal/Viral BACON domain
MRNLSVLVWICVAFSLINVVGCSGPGRTGPDLVPPPTDSCPQSLERAAQSVEAGGGTFSVAVVAAPGCAWTATTTDSWISVSNESKSGSGIASYAVTENLIAKPRDGRIQIGGQWLVINQSAGTCTFSVRPDSQDVPASGGQFEVSLATGDRCPWAASVRDGWVTLASANGTGPRGVSYTVPPNKSTTPRETAIQIADQSVRITQAGADPDSCVSEVTPANQAVIDTGGTFELRITAAQGCVWNAAASDEWIRLTARGGTGSGALSYTVARNETANSRHGTIQIGRRTVSISQAGITICTFMVTPQAFEPVPASGASYPFIISGGPVGCSWTASASADWISLSPASGPGERVTVNVAPNPGGERSGTVQIAGHSLTLTQRPAVPTVVISASRTPIQRGQVSILTWTTTNATTVRLNGTEVPANGSQTVSPVSTTTYTLTAINASGTQTSSTTVEVCDYILSQLYLAFSSFGGTLPVSVQTSAGCSWTAVSNESWFRVSPSSGTGTGQVRVSVDLTLVGAEGVINIAGRSVKVCQDGLFSSCPR